MAQKKKTSNKSKKTAKKPVEKRPVNDGARREIWVLVFFALAVILFLGAINCAGSVGEVLCTVERGLFGSLAYVFPFLFFASAVYLLVFTKKYGAAAVFITSVAFVAFILLCGIFEFLNGKGIDNAALTAGDYYKLGSDGFNGGLFGGLIFKFLSPGLGVLGSYVVLVILEIVCIVFITGKSILAPLGKGGKKIYENTRSGIANFKEDRNERNEQREQLRQQRREEALRVEAESRLSKKAEGVSLDETDLLSSYGSSNVEGRIPASSKTEGIKNKRSGYIDDVSKETSLTIEEAIDAIPGPVVGDAPASDKLNKSYSSLDRLFERMKKNEDESRTEYIRTDIVAEEIDKQAAPAESQGDKSAPIIVNRDNRTLAELEALDVNEVSALAGRDPSSADRTTFVSLGNTSGRASNDGSGSAAGDRIISEFGDDADDVSVENWEVGPEEELPPEEFVEDLDPSEALKRLSMELPHSGYDTADNKAQKPDDNGIWKDGRSGRESTSGVSFSGSGQGQNTVPAGKTVSGGIVSPGVAKPIIKKDYKLPPLSLLASGGIKFTDNRQELRDTANKLVEILKNFGVNVEVTDISCGPAVTRYELHPEMGVKVSRIVGLADDIKLNLAAADIRIEAPIPGKSAVGIEVPNKENKTVYLREILKSDAFSKALSKISVGVGLDIAGTPVVADLAKMPHVLIAGATGSGKSVCINTIIMSILFKATPEEVRFIMIDPKMVELTSYNGIPHLLTPVVTDPKKAAAALNWAVAEMTDRYQRFADFSVRDLKGYNKKIDEMRDSMEYSEEDDDIPEHMSQIVVIVDELADLMMVAPGEVEEAICRLAQLARAAGIHLVIATQRPSVNVITGLIKANVPSRIAFAVASGIDSRTILDMVGAEKLLGRGDMLFYPTGMTKPVRVQGAFVADEEVAKVVDYISAQRLHVGQVNGSLEDTMSQAGQGGIAGGGDERDELFWQCGRFIIDKGKASIGNLQRAFRIGFNRAARIMDQLCDAGIVGKEEGTKPRQILVTLEEFEHMAEEEIR